MNGWINWSTANHPDSWDTQEYGVIEFATPEDAKKAETLFNRLTAEQGKGKEQTGCNHEPFEGRCVHCNIRFIDGEPTIIRTAPIAQAPVAQDGYVTVPRELLVTAIKFMDAAIDEVDTDTIRGGLRHAEIQCSRLLSALPSPTAPDQDAVDADCVQVQRAFLAALRPAVHAQVVSAEQSLLKLDRGDLPSHYHDALNREAQEWQRRLDQIDAAMSKEPTK